MPATSPLLLCLLPLLLLLLTHFPHLLAALALLLCLHFSLDILSHLLAYRRINRRPTPPPHGPFSLAPTALDFAHCTSFILLSFPYHWHALCGLCTSAIRHLFPRTRAPILPTYPVRYLLECSLVNFLAPAPDLGPRHFRLHLKSFLSPIAVGRRDCSLHLEFDIDSALPSLFRYNGLPISAPAEQLSLVILTAATATHPAIHKHQDQHYTHRRRAGPHFDNLFLHGPLLNEYAYFYAGILFRHGVSWFATVLRENAVRMQPPRHDMATYRALMPHSRYVRFAMGTRSILFQLTRIHAVAVDPELFFVNCVIHSLDHVFPSYLDGVYLEHEVTSNTPCYNLVRSFFYDAMGRYEPFETNYLVDHQHRHPFYRDLYKGFSKIDRELADCVTLSISF